MQLRVAAPEGAIGAVAQFILSCTMWAPHCKGAKADGKSSLNSQIQGVKTFQNTPLLIHMGRVGNLDQTYHQPFKTHSRYVSDTIFIWTVQVEGTHGTPTKHTNTVLFQIKSSSRTHDIVIVIVERVILS